MHASREWIAPEIALGGDSMTDPFEMRSIADVPWPEHGLFRAIR